MILKKISELFWLLWRLKVNYAELDKKCITVNIAFKMQPVRVKRGIVEAEFKVLAISNHRYPLEHAPLSDGVQ
jgi:hypothetical protein